MDSVAVHEIVRDIEAHPAPRWEDVKRIATILHGKHLEYGYPYQLKQLLEKLGGWLLSAVSHGTEKDDVEGAGCDS